MIRRETRPLAAISRLNSMPNLPWDVCVLGVPASLQGSSSRRHRWKTEVATAARAAWPGADPPLVRPLRVKITYFHNAAPLDVDNMIKPIQDALIGIVYDDDKRVHDVSGSLRDLSGSFQLDRLTEALATGFLSKGPFVHIHIEEPPNMEVLP